VQIEVLITDIHQSGKCVFLHVHLWRHSDLFCPILRHWDFATDGRTFWLWISQTWRPPPKARDKFS